MISVEDLSKDVNPLSIYYKDFKVTERILLTGHSHQAQPDCAKEGIIQCWNDASELADDKWEKVFAVADKLRMHIAKLLDDDKDNIVLAQNTHDLILRFLSALDFKNRNKIITTDGEFHTIRRQLDRLNQGFIDVVKVKRDPVETLPERLVKEVDNKTAAVMVSKVMFQDAAIVNELTEVESACMKQGIKLLVDVYHVLNAIPFSLKEEKLENSFLVGGGYKYLQLGEGNCFMRIPPNEDYKPVITGWFSEFAALSEKKAPGEVLYGKKHWAFAGSTYDPVSHYRALKVFEFFMEQKLTPEILQRINNHQKKIIESEFEKYDFNISTIKLKVVKDRGGFMTFETPYAGLISKRLRDYNILTDYRGDYLRLGPAPYLTDNQLYNTIDIINKVVKLINT